MKQVWAIFFLLFFIACDTSSTKTNASGENNPSEKAPAITNNKPPQKVKKLGDLDYIIHTNSSGPKAEVGKFLTMHMKYTTEQDSVIFTSFKRAKPLTFRFSKTLFKGALNEGIEQMAAGDSATFKVPAKKLYGSRLPAFVKEGEDLIYTIKLVGIEDKPNIPATSPNAPVKVTKKK